MRWWWSRTTTTWQLSTFLIDVSVFHLHPSNRNTHYMLSIIIINRRMLRTSPTPTNNIRSVQLSNKHDNRNQRVPVNRNGKICWMECIPEEWATSCRTTATLWDWIRAFPPQDRPCIALCCSDTNRATSGQRSTAKYWQKQTTKKWKPKEINSKIPTNRSTTEEWPNSIRFIDLKSSCNQESAILFNWGQKTINDRGFWIN